MNKDIVECLHKAQRVKIKGKKLYWALNGRMYKDPSINEITTHKHSHTLTENESA